MKSKQSSLMPIVDAWGRIDPEAALKWVTVEDVGKAAGFGGITRTDLFHAWSRKDPDDALRWAEAWAQTHQTADGDRAYLYLETLAGYGSEKNPHAATAELYTKIDDPSLRARMLTKHIREWMTDDEINARAWLETNGPLAVGEAAAIRSSTK